MYFVFFVVIGCIEVRTEIMKSILITGCNRGLGLGLVQQLVNLPSPPEKIFATCRDISEATKLKEIADKNKNVQIIEIDLKDTTRYNEIVAKVEEQVGDDGLNVLFNNAAIAIPTTIEDVEVDTMAEVYLVNTIIPVMLTKAFIPLLKKAAQKKNEFGIDRAAIINMSSLVASITENTLGGKYAYRCSKTAINAATKSMSIDLKKYGIMAISMDPGWVQTDMGGSNAKIDVETSTSNIINVLQSLEEKHSGQYIQYSGKILPW